MRNLAVVWPALAAALALAPALTSAQVTGAPPVIESVRGPGEPVLASTATTIAAVATDPAGGVLTYAWTATAGAIVGSGAEATWTAPVTAGSYTITVRVTNAFGSVTSSVAVPVVLAGYRGGLAAPLTAPRRLCADGAGNLFVVDAREGALALLTARGETKGRALLGEPASAVACAPGTLYVATGAGKLLEVDPRTGIRTGELALEGGPLRGPAGIAWEPARGLLWVVERAANRVRAIRPDGTTAFVLAAARGAPLTSPVDVAVDAAGARVWVLLEEPPGAATATAPELGRSLHAFTPDGAYLSSLLLGGTSVGRLSRAGGLAVDAAGQPHVSDVFQGHVLVLTRTGTFRGNIGAYGSGSGGLRNPLGLAFLRNGDLAVANIGASRIERFGAGAELPTCDGDLDCDGLPDEFEASGGLNPRSAGDALADTDGDGLSNLEELALGTSPSLRDTDGDGWSDRDEVVAGFDPRDPADHRPRLLASGPARTAPGLVQLSASLVNGDGCAIAWAQRSGPASVELRDASGTSPSYLARAGGIYAVEARATCGASVSDPVVVETEILQQAPLADAGGIRVVDAGTPLLLDAGASSDANADVLSFSWDQVLGPPVTGPATGPLLPLQVPEAGYYVFAATAKDPAGGEGVAEVPVLVVRGAASTAMVTTPVQTAIGEPVLLDASGSFLAWNYSAFVWSQVDGPPATLDTSAGSVAQFVPAAPGRYGFEVWIDDRYERSPPARIDVFVADGGGRLPAAAVAPPGAAAVGAPLTLDGAASASATGAALAYAWRQVGGPAAGLADADRAVATVVPFAPGSHEFELVVREGGMEGLPARVRFDATRPGVALPVAVASGPSMVARGSIVVLDGTGSTGDGLRYAWTQLAGPWVPLDDPGAASPSFDPKVEGVYTFELVVESGGVRSAPALVSVLVVHPVAFHRVQKERR